MRRNSYLSDGSWLQPTLADLLRISPLWLALAVTTLPLGCAPMNAATGTATAQTKHYDDKDAAIASFDDPTRDAWAKPDEVVQAIGITDPSLTIADIGAGSGYFTYRLARIVPQGTVYAVDVDSDFKRHIEKMRETWGTPNIESRLAVYENPMLPLAAVDIVFLSNTYAYIQDRVGYFKEVHRALKPGGRVIIVDFRGDATCDEISVCPSAEQRVPKARAVEELGQAGFKLEREETFLEHQYFVIAVKQ